MYEVDVVRRSLVWIVLRDGDEIYRCGTEYEATMVRNMLADPDHTAAPEWYRWRFHRYNQQYNNKAHNARLVLFIALCLGLDDQQVRADPITGDPLL